MKVLGITANIEKAHASEAIKIVCQEALNNGFSVVIDQDSSNLADSAIQVVDSIHESADVIVALGGDGTMLRVTRELDGADKPILGINIGNLGFLTSVGINDAAAAFKALAAGEYGLAERSILECRVTRGSSEIASYHALNDAVITNASPSRVVTLDVAVGSDEGTSFVGDGLIVATPSGSTGHSLSSGGPIVHPGVKAMVMSLICPQTLSSRPMVVPSERVINISVQSSSGEVMLTMDGQVSLPLETGDKVEVSGSDRSVKFVQMNEYSYFSVLRRKLHWSLSNTLDADS